MNEYMVDRKAEDGKDFHSSNISALGYDRKTKKLYVQFHIQPSLVYSYAGVGESTYDMFVNDDNVGSFHHHIRSNYVGRIDGEGVIKLRDYEKPDLFERTRFVVEYAVEHKNATPRHRLEFWAVSEADALSQFKEAMSSMTTILDRFGVRVKVVSVTHYHD